MYIIEIPHLRTPSCWMANDEQDFISAVSGSAAAQRSCDTIFRKTSAREELALAGYSSAAEARADGYDYVADLVDKYGLETVLFLTDDGGYTADPVNEFDAYTRWLGSDLSSLLIFDGDDAALAALSDANNWNRHGGVEAKMALADKLRRAGLLRYPQALNS